MDDTWLLGALGVLASHPGESDRGAYKPVWGTGATVAVCPLSTLLTAGRAAEVVCCYWHSRWMLKPGETLLVTASLRIFNLRILVKLVFSLDFYLHTKVGWSRISLLQSRMTLRDMESTRAGKVFVSSCSQ